MKPNQEKKAITVLKRLISKSASSNYFFRVETILDINTLRSLLGINCTDNQILNAISQIKNKQDIAIPEFNKVIESIITNDEKANESTTWTIILPFDAEIINRKLKINSKDFKILKYNSIKKFARKEYYIYVLGDKVLPQKINNYSRRYLEIKSNGSSLLIAWKRLEPSFKILRGILDFCTTSNSWAFIQSNNLARTLIPHPKYIFGVSNSDQTSYVEFIINDSQTNHGQLTKKQTNLFNKLVDFLKDNSESDSIQYLISDLFRLYSEAMDENLYSNSFLRFWQLIERIALSEPRGTSNEQVKNRIGCFLNEVYGLDLSDYFELLVRKRNELVHRGIDNIEISDINLLKNIGERIILWLFLSRRNLKTIKHFESYYNSITRNNLELEISGKMMLKILQRRKKQ